MKDKNEKDTACYHVVELPDIRVRRNVSKHEMAPGVDGNIFRESNRGRQLGV